MGYGAAAPGAAGGGWGKLPRIFVLCRLQRNLRQRGFYRHVSKSLTVSPDDRSCESERLHCPPVATFASPYSCVSGVGGHMPHQLLELRCSGADDKPTCPNCGNAMRLRNSSPDPAYGLRYERQTFTCAACDFRIERSVDADGKPPELLRY